MVTLLQRLPQDAFRRGRVAARYDATVYKAFIGDLEAGQGGLIELEPGEHQRVIKRRVSLVAREHHLRTKWLTAAAGQLRFQLIARKEPAKPTPPAPSTPPVPLPVAAKRGRPAGTARRGRPATTK